MSDTKKLKFILMYELSKVPPLLNEIEAGLVYTENFPKLGLYGDRNFLVYYKNQNTAAYYEENEMRLAAQSALNWLNDQKNYHRYLKLVIGVVEKVDKFIRRVGEKNIDTISDKELFKLVEESLDLDQEAFAYYSISQPQMVSLFEQKIKDYLAKKVEVSRVGEYLSKLTLSPKPTTLAKEELEWLQLIKKAKQEKIVNASFIQEDIQNHFQKYKTLGLGDDNWQINPRVFIDKFDIDIKMNLKDIIRRIKELEEYQKTTRKKLEQLYKQLDLSPELIKFCRILAELGHTRFQLRTKGWVPLIPTRDIVTKEAQKRLGLPGETIFMTTKKELLSFFQGFPTVTIEELKEREKIQEYLLLIRDGKLEIYFGPQSSKIFNELVPKEDLSKIEEFSGHVAMPGQVTGRVCLYSWGDRLGDKLKVIKKNKILVAGQTRPQMMPLIRLAEGIITDEGGVISHAAIVSRELGIPCIMGTKNGSKILKEGQLVHLDADTGIVKILK